MHTGDFDYDDGKLKAPKYGSAYKRDLEYIPGDFTEPEQRLPSRQLLLDQKYERDYGIDAALPLNPSYLAPTREFSTGIDTQNYGAAAVHEVNSATRRDFPALAAAVSAYRRGENNFAEEPTDSFKPGRDLVLPVTPIPNYAAAAERITPDLQRNMPMHSITGKPNERCPSPVVPAYANFELAKRMHQDNLDHQPLPDCVADLAFRKAQISGGHAGLSLEIDPIATGVGVKTHNAGPTHCTKMKVFRPSSNNYRGIASAPTKKMGAMDLAIGWDYKPANPLDEPRPAKHIDGSNESAGPAVFTCVKTPREEPKLDLGRSAGVFNSTLGETDFFDKDILQRKTDFGGRSIKDDAECACDYTPTAARARSMTRDPSALPFRRPFDHVDSCDINDMPRRLLKQYQSNPMLSNKDKEYKALRAKYLGPDPGEGLGRAMDFTQPEPHCKRNTFFRRPGRARSCHKVAPAPNGCCGTAAFDHCLPSKAAFRAGVPKLNAMGDFINSDAGCSLTGNRVLVVPRPKNPYSKKNYDIDTLVPPFRSMGGGAKQGGYPEHWRLSSVYQHAYKPVEQRRRPLLETVYK